MSDDDNTPRIEPVNLPDGRVAYVLSKVQQAALAEIISDRVWWDGAIKRFRRTGLWVAGFFAMLAFLAQWWPWITHIMQALIKDVPS